MLADLFAAFPELRHFLDADPAVSSVIYPPHAFDPAVAEAQSTLLRDTRCAQPALGIVESALCALLDRVEVRPDLLAGHSYGELVALSVAGSFDLPALLRLSHRRAEAILSAAGADPGAMAAVRASAAEVTEAVRDIGVVVANHNSPEQVVLSGPAEAIERAVEQLRSRSFAVKRLPVACAFHSPLLAGAEEEFAAALARERVQAPRTPVWSNRRAAPHGDAVRAELAAQITAPVRFAEQVEDMYAAGARTFVEVGPGTALTGFVRSVLADREHTAVACDPGSTPGLRGLLTALARLAVAGVDVRAEWLFRGRAAAGAERADWAVDGRRVHRADGTRVPHGLVPARRITLSTESTVEDRERLVSEFLRSSREAVVAQRDVLLGYFGTPAGAVAPPLPPGQAEEPERLPVPEPREAEEDRAVDAHRTVVEVIGGRTGYPAEMITGDLDLETDLSIDSIKRTEIAGILLAELGLRDRVSAAEQEELSRERTVNAIVRWVEAHFDSGVQRMVLRPVAAAEIANHDTLDLREKVVLLVHEPSQEALCDALRVELARYGATVVAGVAPAGGVDAVLCLTPLVTADEPVAAQVFSLLRDSTGASALVAAPLAATPPEHAAGLRGLLRAVAKEREDIAVKLVELDLDEQVPDLARSIVGELRTDDRVPVVRRHSDLRTGFRLDPEPLTEERSPQAADLGLDRESVVLLVGGARGITARVAVELAATTGCRIELAGRTPCEPEDPATRQVTDPQELRRALAADGRSIAEVERRVQAVLARREVARTLEEIRSAGSEVHYHCVDVRDGAALGQLVKDLHTRQGGLDGVVHAAGVIDDRLMADKDDASFREVFGTKVDGARVLLDALTQLGVHPRFVVFFGSIAAALGNRGQTDYAAANDALESLGAAWSERTGNRALTVHWGPWAPSAEHGGMVSEELARDYQRRGVRLIDPVQGPACLLRELAFGTEDSVVYAASTW